MSGDVCELLCLDAPRAERIREGLVKEESAREAAERAKALSDPTRLTLVCALRGAGADDSDGELCVCDLAWISGRAQNLVSHHMKILRSGGVVRSRKDGKMVMYSLTEAGESLLSAALGEGAAVKP